MVRKLASQLDAVFRTTRALGAPAVSWQRIEHHLGCVRDKQGTSSCVRSLVHSAHEDYDDAGGDEEDSKPQVASPGPHNDGDKTRPKSSRYSQEMSSGVPIQKKSYAHWNWRSPMSQLRKVQSPDGIVTRLASEAVQEIQRLKNVNGLQNEDTRKSVWHILKLFREIVRDQNEKRGQAGGTVETSKILSPRRQESALRLTEEIQANYAHTKAHLESLIKPDDSEAKRASVTDLIQSYQKFLEVRTGGLNATNIVVMLHHFASLAKSTSMENWMTEHHAEFLANLIREVKRRIGLFDPQGYATIIWSLGRMGPGVKAVEVASEPFETLMGSLLEVAIQDLRRYTINDSLNIVLGLAEMELSQNVSGPFLRDLIRSLHNRVDELPPSDLVALLWAFGKLDNFDSSELVTKMCDAVETRIEEFDFEALSAFFKALAGMGHLGTMGLIKKALSVTNKTADELDLQSISKMLWAFLRMSVYPGDVLMNRWGDLFSEKPEQLTPGIVTATILALTYQKEAHSASLEAAKTHFKANASQYTPHDAAKLLWSLSMMDGLDADVLDSVGNSTFGKLQTGHKRVLDIKRQLCQVLISWRILNGQPPPAFVTHDLEDKCYEAWRSTQRSYTTFGLFPEIISLFRSAGFVCRSPLILDQIPMSITSAVREGSPDKQDLKLVLEVGSRLHGFRNKTDFLKPRQRWRTKVLEAVGWSVLRVPVSAWRKLPNSTEKASFLKKLIYKKTSVVVNFLESSPPEADSRVSHGPTWDRTEEGASTEAEREDTPSASSEDDIEDEETGPSESQSTDEVLEDIGNDFVSTSTGDEGEDEDDQDINR